MGISTQELSVPMFLCAITSATTALVSGVLGFGFMGGLGTSSSNALLAIAVMSGTIALGALEACESQGTTTRPHEDH